MGYKLFFLDTARLSWPPAMCSSASKRAAPTLRAALVARAAEVSRGIVYSMLIQSFEATSVCQQMVPGWGRHNPPETSQSKSEKFY